MVRSPARLLRAALALLPPHHGRARAAEASPCRPGNARRRLLRACGLAAVVAAIGLTFGGLLGPFDFLTFLEAGRRVLHDQTPYPSTSSAVFRSGHAFVYPLVAAWPFAPLALLSRHGAEGLYEGASVVAIVVSCRLLGRRDATTAVLVLVSSTTIIGLQMGTVNAFLLLGLAFGWHWRSSRPLLAGVALGLAAAAKLFLLPVVLWPLLRRRWSLAASAAVTVVFVGCSGVALGVISATGYVRLLTSLSANEVTSSWSLESLAENAGLPAGAAGALAAVVVVTVLAHVWRRRREMTEGQVIGLLVVCSLLMSPIVWSSYLLLLVVPVLLGARPDVLLPLLTVSSWVLVTPDAAPPGRVAAGIALAVACTAVSLRRYGLDRRAVAWLRASPRRTPASAWVAAIAASVAVFAALPGPVRSPLPALVAVGAVAAVSLRRLHGAPGGDYS